MASIRFTDVQARPSACLDVTSLTLDEFQQLVPPFETAFQAHLAASRLDGKPLIARRFTVYKNCPLPTLEDRLFFILVYLKTYAPGGARAPVRHGLKQSQSVDSRPPAHTAGSALHPRRCPGPFPHGPGPAVRRGGGRRAHGSHAAAGGTGVPPLPMTGRNGALSAPKTRLNKKHVIAARKRTTPSKMRG